MDTVKEVFRAAAAALAPLLSNPGAGLPGRAGVGSILEQLFPVRGALSRVPLPVVLPTPLPNPLKSPSPQPDRNAARPPSAPKSSRASPAGQPPLFFYFLFSGFVFEVFLRDFLSKVAQLPHTKNNIFRLHPCKIFLVLEFKKHGGVM